MQTTRLVGAFFLLAAAVRGAPDAPILVYRPAHSELRYTFGGAAPARHVRPGTRIVSWTEDCYDGAVAKPGQLPSQAVPPGHDNPQTGPLLRRLGRAGGHARRAHREARARPRLGDLLLLPGLRGFERHRPNGDAGSEPPEVRAGNTVYLGVRVPGALLSFGDGHFAMGDGEIIGAAVEGAMNVEVTVELVKHRGTLWPRIENSEWMMSVGAARPLEDAARVAFKDMVSWVREKTGMEEMDAYEFVSQNARAPIVQIVDPQYTVLVKLPKSQLPKAMKREK